MLRRLLPPEFRERYAQEILMDHEARGSSRAVLAWDVLLTAVGARLDGRRRAVAERRGIAGGSWLGRAGDGGMRNVGYAFRKLRRGPGFAIAAILTLALGIGANTAAFSVMYGMLLRPLPYPHGERLAWVATQDITPENLQDWREALSGFERLEAFTVLSRETRGQEGTRTVRGMAVTRSFLQLLGARVAEGRLFTPEESSGAGGHAVLLSERGREAVGGIAVGQQIRLGEDGYTVVGVLPRSFEGLGYEADFWVPVAELDDAHLNGIGLLRPGVEVALVRAQASALLARLHPERKAAQNRANIDTLRTIFSGDVRAPVLILFAAATLVLLMACINVASLLLARAAGRIGELAMRSALGATRGTLLGQLLVETGVLAALGGAAGLGLAWLLIEHTPGASPAPYLGKSLGTVHVGIAPAMFALTVTLLTSVGAGAAPAFTALRRAHPASSAGARATGTRGAQGWTAGFVTLEVALSFVLLASTLLLVRSYAALRPTDPGFEPRDRVAVSLGLPAPEPRYVRQVEAAASALERSVPGARAAAISFLPMTGMVTTATVRAVDGVPLEGNGASIHVQSVTPGYFDVAGMRRLAGRDLAEADGDGPGTIVINRSVAERLWPGKAAATGHRILVEHLHDTEELTVVGVVADVRGPGPAPPQWLEAYVPMVRAPMRSAYLMVHLPPGARLSERRVQRIVAEIDPRIAVDEVVRLEDVAANAVYRPRYQMLAMSSFGVIALLLAVLGCYGVLANWVSGRRREIGIRRALGAAPSVIVGLVMRRGALLIGTGLAAGALLTLAGTRILRSSLYGVSPMDPLALTAAAVVLVVVTAAAVFLPARRAARVPPTESLTEQ